MDHDDRQVGQILSRREVIKLLGAAVPACVVRPELTEGPYTDESRIQPES